MSLVHSCTSILLVTFFLLCLLVEDATPSTDKSFFSRTRRDLTSSNNNNPSVFRARLSDWTSRALGNPCRADVAAAANFFQRTADQVLDVTGREREIRMFAGNALAAIADLSQYLVPADCHDLRLETLPALPSVVEESDESASANFPPQLLAELYRSLYWLAAHFDGMQSDWEKGRSCSRESETIALKVFRLKSLMRLGLCVLMSPGAATASAPFPSQSMLEEHRSALQQRHLLHYRDCSGRMVRDCILLNNAATLLQIMVARTKL